MKLPIPLLTESAQTAGNKQQAVGGRWSEDLTPARLSGFGGILPQMATREFERFEEGWTEREFQKDCSVWQSQCPLTI